VSNARRKNQAFTPAALASSDTETATAWSLSTGEGRNFALNSMAFCVAFCYTNFLSVLERLNSLEP
jgi:hypothetical protein